MAAPGTMSAFSRGMASFARSQSVLIRPATFCTRLQPQSYTPARPFSVVHPLRIPKNIPSPPKADLGTLKTPTYKPPPPQKQKHNKHSAVSNQSMHAMKTPKTDAAKPTKAKEMTTTKSLVEAAANAGPVAGTVATRMSLAYMHKLTVKGTETPLYEAPSHVWFTVGSLFTGVFCISYAFYNSYFHVMHPPPGVMWWVPYSYGLICATMAGMGMYFFLGPAKIISHIKTLPATEELLKKAKTKAARESKLLIEVGIRRPLPGFEPRKIYVASSDIAMKKRLSAPLMRLSAGELIAMERQLKGKREEEIKYDMENLMTTPFRQTGRAFKEFFGGMMRMMSREGFADVIVAGRGYKLDILGGWALEDGKAIDRLLTPKEDDAAV